MTEPDGMQEEVEAVLRVGLTAAGQFAERRARERADALRAAADRSTAEARDLERRLDAERSLAHQQLAATHQDRWWLVTDPKQVADTWRVAEEWRGYDPVMAAEHARMRSEVQRRFGIDPLEPGGDPAAVEAELRRWADRAAADATASAAAAARDASTASAVLASDQARQWLDGATERAAGTADAPALDREGLERALGREAAAEADWDTAAARAGRADRVGAAAQGDAETAEAVTQADTFQATPPSAAVNAGRHPAVKKPRRRGRGAAVSPDLSR